MIKIGKPYDNVERKFRYPTMSAQVTASLNHSGCGDSISLSAGTSDAKVRPTDEIGVDNGR